MNKGITKVKVAIIATVLIFAVAGAGYWYYEATRPKPPQTLVISHWGFGWDDIKKILIEPFENQYNAKIVLVAGTTSERYTKLKAGAEPIPDVIFLPDFYTQGAAEVGLLEAIDYAKIPNFAKLHPKLKELFQVTEVSKYGVPFTIQDLGIAYVLDKHPKVTSWKDFEREDFKDLILWPTITATSGPMSLVAVSLAYGGTVSDVSVAFEKLELLKGRIVTFYTRSADPQMMFERKEVEIAPVLRYNWAPLMALKKVGINVELVYPIEGSVFVLNLISIVKGSKNADLAYKLIDFWLSADIQKKLAEAGVDAPLNADVKLPSDHPYNIDGVFIKPIYLDPKLLAEKLDSWTKEWKERIEVKK